MAFIRNGSVEAKGIAGRLSLLEDGSLFGLGDGSHDGKNQDGWKRQCKW